jgi:hypothetical protein
MKPSGILVLQARVLSELPIILAELQNYSQGFVIPWSQDGPDTEKHRKKEETIDDCVIRLKHPKGELP